MPFNFDRLVKSMGRKSPSLRKENSMKYVIKEICDNGERDEDPWYHRYVCYANNQKITFDNLEDAISKANSAVAMPHNGVIGYSIEKGE